MKIAKVSLPVMFLATALIVLSLAGRSSSAPAEENPRSRTGDSLVRGTWTLVSVERDGKPSRLDPGGVTLVVTNDYWIWQERGEDRLFRYHLGGERRPTYLDLRAEGDGRGDEHIAAIYAVEDGRLRVCESDDRRPTGFGTEPGDGRTLFTWERHPSIAAGRAPAVPRLRMSVDELSKAIARLSAEEQNELAEELKFRDVVPQMPLVLGETVTKFYRLQHVAAEDVAQALNDLAASTRKMIADVTVDPRTNGLIVRGSNAVIEEIDKIIKDLDRRWDQPTVEDLLKAAGDLVEQGKLQEAREVLRKASMNLRKRMGDEGGDVREGK